MTVLRRYLAAAGQSTAVGREPAFDELATVDGTVRQGWSSLLEGLDEFADKDLLQAQREVARLLEDDNVTYTPSPASAISIADEPDGHSPAARTPTGLVEPQPWRLDPLPLILDDREWASLEAGLVQRMVNDAAGGDALPLLAYTLRLLYDRTGTRHGSKVTPEDYDAIGGVEGALQTRADMVAGELQRHGLGDLVEEPGVDLGGRSQALR